MKADCNTLSVALATGYRSDHSASRLDSRRNRYLVPVPRPVGPEALVNLQCISGVGANVRDRRAVAGSRQGRRAVRWASPGGAGPTGRNGHDRRSPHTPPTM